MTTFTREDFEMAAKAIGHECVFNLANAPQLWKDGEYVCFWNPPGDAGDSLRLSAALGLCVDVHRVFPYCGWPSPWVEVRGFESRLPLAQAVATDNGASLEVATCHAIFRAAIAMGRAML